MELYQITYYLGLSLALILCWNLGPLFYSFILFQFATDILLSVGWLTQGDMQIKWAIIDAITCLWILIFANIFRSRSEAISIFVLIVFSYTYGIYPSLVEASDNWEEWVELTTRMMRGWALINAGIIAIVVGKSLYLWRTGKAPNDLVVNPRRRFLLPIWAWAIIVAMPVEWLPWNLEWFDNNRFTIAAHTQVWGWVFLELKFFLQARYWRQKYGYR